MPPYTVREYLPVGPLKSNPVTSYTGAAHNDTKFCALKRIQDIQWRRRGCMLVDMHSWKVYTNH